MVNTFQVVKPRDFDIHKTCSSVSTDKSDTIYHFSSTKLQNGLVQLSKEWQIANVGKCNNLDWHVLKRP